MPSIQLLVRGDSTIQDGPLSNVIHGVTVLRFWLFLSILLFAPVGGGLLPPISSGEVCVQRCQDDDEQGQCAPDCIDCTCCSHVRLVVVAPTVSTVPMAPWSPLTVEHDEDEPSSVKVGDIQHVPIAPLA